MTLRSLVWNTDVDVLPRDRELRRGDGYWVVRSPGNPAHYWGNLLIFDAAPGPGDRERWIDCFRSELPGVEHCTLAWDVIDGSLGAAASEFADFELEGMVGMLAAPGSLTVPARHAAPQATLRELSGEDPGWSGVLAIQEAWNRAREDPFPAYRAFAQQRIAEWRGLIAEGRGAWFVAEDAGRVVGSLGVIVTDGRARYQAVDVAAGHRRRGIASHLVWTASVAVARRWPVQQFVIAAEPGYHALGLYEELGFRRAEHVHGVFRRPSAAG